MLKIFAVLLLAAASNNFAKESVAVFEFPNPGNQITALSSYLADDISIQLASDTTNEVVERGQLQRILQEQGLQNAGGFDDKMIVKIGGLCGATRVVLGKYYQLGDGYEVVYRTVDVKSAKIINFQKRVITKTESLSKLDAIIIPSQSASLGSQQRNNPQSSAKIEDGKYTIGPVTIDICKPSIISGFYACSGSAYSEVDGRVEFDTDNSYMYFNNGARGTPISRDIGVSHRSGGPIVGGVKHSIDFTISINDVSGLASVQKSKLTLKFNGSKFENETALPFKF